MKTFEASALLDRHRPRHSARHPLVRDSRVGSQPCLSSRGALCVDPAKVVTRGKEMTSDTQKRELVIAKGWVQAAVLVFLFGFTVLGWLAYRTYMDEPPIPQRVVDPAGNVLFTDADVMSGQQVFLR